MPNWFGFVPGVILFGMGCVYYFLADRIIAWQLRFIQSGRSRTAMRGIGLLGMAIGLISAVFGGISGLSQ